MSDTLNNPVCVTREIAGRTLTLETGRMAKQADGAIFATYGETSLLATAQGAKGRADLDFFPLTVEYREKIYAAGKVPGGFFKREARPRDHEILAARAIDRPVRPLWPDGYREEVQIIVQVLSYDRVNEGDVLGATAASAALCLSSLPFQGPIASVRVGYDGENFILFPTVEQMAESQLDLVVAGGPNAVNMVEASANELPDDLVADAIFFAHEGIKDLCSMISELQEKAGREKVEPEAPEANPFTEKVEEHRDAMKEAMAAVGKHVKNAAIKDLRGRVVESLTEGLPEEDVSAATKQIKNAFHDLEGDVERRGIIEDGKRSDGRALDEIRTIEIELGVLARTHGSALFTRGETQALVSATLGTGRDEQIVDGLGDEYSKRFMLHYNFPPFCVGEVRRMFSTSRREIGHGNLAERAVRLVMPSPEDFPYSVRIVSEILESNGSSSMASVCGATLALLDAGCPLHVPVAGIAMGLIQDGDDYHVLSDILGSEDHNGDMDFKVTGSREGVTAVQMDIKIKGLPIKELKRALQQARDGRTHILEKMQEAISEARTEVSQWAPQIVMRQIDKEKIGGLIGPGGKVIRALQADYNVGVEVNDEGVVTIAGGPDGDIEGAVKAVEAICGDAEVGAVYKGKIVSLRDFGAFAEIFPGKEGLLHISEISRGPFIKNLGDVLKVGDEIEVKCTNVDELGRIRLQVETVPEGHPLAPYLVEGAEGDQRESRPDSQPQGSIDDLEVGADYEGTVHGIKEYGVFVEILPGVRGLCHISEMAEGRVEDPNAMVSMGDSVNVRLLGIEDGEKLRLSMKAVDSSEGEEPVPTGAGDEEDSSE